MMIADEGYLVSQQMDRSIFKGMLLSIKSKIETK
jgi:hypothetical protein